MVVTVEFRLLGDVGLIVDGTQFDIGPARQRCVLAALLVDANRVVPVEQLLDRVWAGREPQRARNILSSYVSRLRKVLAVAPGVGITRPGGYLLTVDLETVDLYRFRRTVAEARESVDAEHALALFDEALGLWRGEAFAQLDTPWLNQVRVMVDAQRLTAETDRNDLALGQGRHSSLLSELLERAAAWPLDERLAGQLMLALYRCGRQAEALRHFEELRRRLADELGADPGPALSRLHRQVLRNDPSLASSGPAGQATVRSGSPVPRQLPVPPHMLSGRRHELVALDAFADEAMKPPAVASIVAISGTAGVGKTALAVHWAYRAAERFSDGQLYVDLRGYGPDATVMAPAEAVRGLLDALGVPPERIPTTVDAQTGLYRSLLAGRRMLILLDNARDAEQVLPLLPGSGNCLVVVTSRSGLTRLVTSHGAHPLDLDLPTMAEARDMLLDRLRPARSATTDPAVDQIVTRCARLPLALAIVAARAATHPAFPLAAIANELAHAPDWLTTFAGGDAASDVQTVFSWSYRTLSPDAARLFRLLGLHPGPHASAAAAASLAGLPLAEVRRLLAELATAHVLTEDPIGRYYFHDLLREYAHRLCGRLDGQDERRAAIHRMLDHYVHTARAAALAQHPHRRAPAVEPARPGVSVETPEDHGAALAWFSTEHRVLLAATDLAHAAGFDQHSWMLAWTLWTFLDRLGHWHDLATAGQVGLEAARRLGDPAAQAAVHRMLTRACVAHDRFEEAHTHLAQALDGYRQAGDLAGLADTHSNLGWVCSSQGRLKEAIEHAMRALAQHRAAGNKRGEAHALNVVGWYHALIGDHRQAIVYCERALASQPEPEDPVELALTWHSLGFAHHHLGEHTQAITCLGRALDLFRELKHRYYEADTLARLGDTYAAIGENTAVTLWRQSLAILDDLEHPDANRLRARLDGSA
jgi:DNA-binding SARP family transcriptional activator